MKVTFETATIADAVKKAGRVAPSRGSAFDKAAGLVFDIDPAEEEVVIRATNLDIFYREWVDPVSLEGDNPVAWRVPSKILVGLLSSLPIGSGKEVVFEEVVNGRQRQLKIRAGRTRCTLNLMDMDYYPDWNVFDPERLFPAADLGGRIGMVEWAADKQNTIPYSGVYFNGEIAAATDKYRFALTPLPIPDMGEPLTIPAGLLTPILKQTGEVMIGVDGQQLLIMPDEHTQIRSVVYAESYPDIQSIITRGRSQPDRVSFKKNDLLELMNRSMNFVGADRAPVIQVIFGKEEINVGMINDEVGLFGDTVDVPGQALHPRVAIKYTPANIMEALSSAPNETVTVGYDASNPLKLTYIDGGSGYEAFVAPRRDMGEKSND